MATTKNGKASSLGDRVFGPGRRATTVTLDAYQQAVDAFADYESGLGEAIGREPAKTVASTHATIVRELAGAQVSVARSLLRV